MRIDDLPMPAITPRPLPPQSPMYKWPAALHIALERLPQAAYTWDDADDAVVWDATTADTPGYLTPTVGTVTTADVPGLNITADVTVTANVRFNNIAVGTQYIVTHMGGAGDRAFAFSIFNGSLFFQLSIDGTVLRPGSAIATAAQLTAAGIINDVDVFLAATIDLDDGAGRLAVRAYHSSDGITWTAFGNPQIAAPAITAVFDSTAPLKIGALGVATGPLQGRIYSVELRTGLDPAAGAVLWRFDADDYPGTGTAYTDPRGRTWTLTNAAAITPKVPGDPLYVWDAPFIGSGFTDAVCDFHALTIDPGEIDELGLFPPAHMTLTVANPDGEYTVWTVDGRLTYWAPGRRVAVWADLAGEPWWLFAGRMTGAQINADGTVTFEAFDGLAQLADELASDWTPGATGQTPLGRIAAVAAQVGYTDPIMGDVGDNDLSTALTDMSPLEACQQAALSDGGLFAGDADGVLVYRDRTWRTGRADQETVPVFSDNVCTVANIIWDPEMAADDEGLYTTVELINAAGVRVTATLSPGQPGSWWEGVQYRLTHPDPDLWQNAVDGQQLADYLLAQQSTPSMAIRAFTLHLLDPKQDLWRTGIDLRRGDRIRFIHEFPAADGPGQLDLQLIAATIGHEITPDSWLVTVAATRTVDYLALERWDLTTFTWDDPDPANVWRY